MRPMETPRVRLRVEALEVHWLRWNGAWTPARADATVIGGWAAYQEAVREVKAAIARGRAILADRAQREAVASWWERSESALDDELLDVLSWSVPSRSDEDPAAYEARLLSVVVNLRGRLDGASDLLADEGALARVREMNPINGKSVNLPAVEAEALSAEPTGGWSAPSKIAEPTEAELMLPARDAAVRELERLRAQRNASLTDDERFRLGKRRLLRRISAERDRQAERGA